ncbi:MAG: hypothetical protein QXU69_08575, partial [Thermofilaceae archaeon]
KTYTTQNEVALHLAGDKVLLYLEGLGRFSLCDMSLNEIALINSTTDFSRIYYLAVHRYGKVPEVYSGYGDGASPRCPKPYGTCASELERYAHGSSSTELLCPNENCEEGNVYAVFYDAKTGKLLVNTGCDGNKLYLVDPNTGTYTKWPARGAASGSHFGISTVIYDDTYLYVLIDAANSFEVRRYRVDEFFEVFGTGAIEDYGERVFYEALPDKGISDRRMLSFAPNKNTIYIGYPGGRYQYDPINNTFTEVPFDAAKRYFGKYTIGGTASSLTIGDLDAMTVVQTISPPAGQTHELSSYTQQVDPPFFFTYDGENMYAYVLTYNGVAPVIQYDHVNRKIRVVDYLTGNPLNATLWVWRSRFAYPRDAYPLNIAPTTMTVSDWTSIPAALKTECLTFAIKDVVA